ncbi:hypothetical protein C8Q74DRAFT_1370771 [Fomes fomentarius]|nr:hypothetical protein C8Q74DRAFT_1370771 [Fomes fomentarius]
MANSTPLPILVIGAGRSGLVAALTVLDQNGIPVATVRAGSAGVGSMHDACSRQLRRLKGSDCLWAASAQRRVRRVSARRIVGESWWYEEELRWRSSARASITKCSAYSRRHGTMRITVRLN